MVTLVETFDIAAYCRISVDEEMNRENTSIENQKAIIEDFVKRKFSTSSLTFYADRDRSGYTFEQRPDYQRMRTKLFEHKYDILIINDLSRFSRRNGRGLVELEDLRDQGVRIISLTENVDYPTNDDWLAIQIHFFVNEMPVTETSKKVKNVIKRRQNDGRWICAVPYGYVITDTKNMTFEMDESSAQVIQMIYKLYNEGWGYKKIANHLTDLKIPTPRTVEKERKLAAGAECSIRAKQEWSIVTVQGILENDFYIGTLRQGKYARKKINGTDMKLDADEHIVFENNHEPVIDYRTFAIAQEQRKKRTTTNYRGVKVNENVYSGFIFCGDCGSPMFSMSRRDLRPAYTCGSYHQRGLKGCTSHHTRVDILDTLLKSYVKKVRDNSADMIEKLEQALKRETEEVKTNDEIINKFEEMLNTYRDELKIAKRQKIREIIKRPDREEIIEETYAEIESEIEAKIEGLQNQITMTADKRNTIIQVNRIAKTAIDIFNDILNKEKFDKMDLELIIERIVVYEDYIEIKLKNDIDAILKCGTLEETENFPHDTKDIVQIVQSSPKHEDKVFRVNVICNGDPLEIFTDREGEVIFKKYSPIGELGNFATQYAETLSKTSGHTVCITDKDSIIAVSGAPKRDLAEKRISSDLEKIMEEKTTFIMKPGDSKRTSVVDGIDKYVAAVVAPIIAEGDTIGTVVMVGGDDTSSMGEVETKLAHAAANFLASQMEH